MANLPIACIDQHADSRISQMFFILGENVDKYQDMHNGQNVAEIDNLKWRQESVLYENNVCFAFALGSTNMNVIIYPQNNLHIN